MERPESDVEKWLKAHPPARDGIVVGGGFVWFAGMMTLLSQERTVLGGILLAIVTFLGMEATLRLRDDSLFRYYLQNPAADSGVRRWLEEHPHSRDFLTVVGYIGMFTGFGMLAAGELRSSAILLWVSLAIVLLIGIEATARWKGDSIFRYSRNSVPE